MNSRYDVLTWDCLTESYTEQDGMVEPCLGVTLSGLRRALRELRSDFAYCCRRIRLADGSYSSDPAVLVERVDDSVIDA